MTYFVILPNQLFEYKYLPKNKTFIIWEHPHYFTSYKYNKKKLMLHKASMLHYYDYLKSKVKTKYIKYDEPFTIDNYELFDPIDIIDLPNTYDYVESPNFILTLDEYELYRCKTDKFVFNNFYMWAKKLKNIIPNVKSTDKENRQGIKQSIERYDPPTSTSKYHRRAIQFANTFNTYGNTDNFNYPVTHSDAKRWLKDFIKYKLSDFGTYQDGIDVCNNILNHSLLSSSLNIGLLQPMQVIIEVLKYDIPINSLEGFIRQLFWREYQRYCYIYFDFDNNYFNNNKKLTNKWYNGTLNVLPVDDAIKSAFDTGYLHHIQRLMVIGNYMNLSGIKPDEGFKWFMEFAIDSYEWVMYQNVYEMVFFCSGGKTMRKPYFSSSNYILKQSNYKKGEWSEIWDTMYRNFIKKHKNKLQKFKYYYRNI